MVKASKSALADRTVAPFGGVESIRRSTTLIGGKSPGLANISEGLTSGRLSRSRHSVGTPQGEP